MALAITPEVAERGLGRLPSPGSSASLASRASSRALAASLTPAVSALKLMRLGSLASSSALQGRLSLEAQRAADVGLYRRSSLASPPETPRTPSSVGQRSETSAATSAAPAAAPPAVVRGFAIPQHAALAQRPDIAGATPLKVTAAQRLTPPGYDRNVFHLELDVGCSPLENYADGSALSIYAMNDAAAAGALLERLGYDADAVVEFAGEEDGEVILSTLRKLATTTLDLEGAIGLSLLQALYPHCADIYDKVAMAELTLPAAAARLQALQRGGCTLALLLEAFPSCRPPAAELPNLVPRIKQRVYSVASSAHLHPTKLQLLVVEETFPARPRAELLALLRHGHGQPKSVDDELHVKPEALPELGEARAEERSGLCSGFLATLQPGAFVEGHLTHSVMRLPEDARVPIVCAGLGTGLAPHRAFFQQRLAAARRGEPVGEMTLYFGGRHAAAEFYYRDELESAEAAPWFTQRNAWSRDQAQKVYIQHLVKEDRDKIWATLGAPQSTGMYFLCGPTWPAADIQKAIEECFVEVGGLSAAAAAARVQELITAKRWVVEVY